MTASFAAPAPAVRRRLPGRAVPLLPETSEYRPLRGHTITLERAYDTNRVWVARRLHGRLMGTYHIPVEPGVTAEELARALAVRYDARFLPPAEAAAIVAAAPATLRTGEIADMLQVAVCTVQRWTKAGLITNVAPPHMAFEFRAAEVYRVLCPGAAVPVGALITPRAASKILQVATSTLLRYADTGLLSPVRLVSGHRRYRQAEVRALAATPPAAR